VDDLPPATLKDAPRGKLTRRRMYVGGLPSKLRKVFSSAHQSADSSASSEEELEQLVPQAFTGCIRDFRVNEGPPQDLLATARDVLPCTHTRDVAYVHHGGHALFGRASKLDSF
jgi:hypothetical protein